MFSRKNHVLKTLLLLIVITISLPLHAQTPRGFIQQDNIKVSGVTTDAQVYPLTTMQKQTTRSYVDGLGRPLQTVALQTSPAGNDMIAPAAYDNLGRQTKGYLPYAGQSTDVSGSFRPNAISTDQPAFYHQTTQYLIPVDGSPYSQRVFDNSPLQRLLQAGQVGDGFQPGQHYKTVVYRYNTSTDNVLVWTWNGSTYTTSSTSTYLPNTLSVTDGTDEDGIETLIFTDLAGRTILKRQVFSPNNLDTYYIYNNQGMVAYILPPKAMAIMNLSGNYSLAQGSVAALTYSYFYDTRGRVLKKILPGGVILNYIYDLMNRLVLVQDSKLAASHQWNYIKYDVKGRAISQGIYTDVTDTTAALMQAYVNSLGSASWYESRNTTASTGYYTNNIFPTGSVPGSTLRPLAYEYFDNYTLDGTTFYSFHASGLPVDPVATGAFVKGMPTMVQKCTVGSGLAATWLISVIFYDHNLHPIQTQTNNLLDYAGATTPTDFKTTLPDFTGMPTTSMTSVQSSGSTNTTVQTTITYDQAYRVTAVDQNYNGGTTTHVAQYVYSEAGQLVQKKLGSADAVTWLQLVDFRYNIRGQLVNINNSTLTHNGQTDDDPDPVFGMTLLYDQTDSNLGNTGYYSGRLSAVKWMSKDGSNTSSKERAFTYNYDAADRYTAANYAERSGSGSFTFTHGWDEAITAYDENGNIKTLTRNATTQGSGSYTPVDNLTYTYQTNNANQLYTVTDATNNQTGFGIQSGGSATGHYQYDVNGNLTNDPYKALTINYDGINKIDKITMTAYTGQYIQYIYDATGNVLEKQQYISGTLHTATVYINGFVYVNGTLAYFPTPEGRVTYNGTTFTNEYIISDQQGNARISFNNTGTSGAREVIQENSYYGFGMIMPGSVVGPPAIPNKNLYNGGSEWQNDYGNMPDYYQTFNRNYDAAIGRFISQDPMPETAADMSVYHYAGDNPVMMNDPMGNHVVPGNTYNFNYVSPLLPNSGPPPGGAFDYAWGQDFGGGDNLDTGGPFGLFWSQFLYTAVTGRQGTVAAEFSGSAIADIYKTWSGLGNGDQFGISYNTGNGAVDLLVSREIASIDGYGGYSDTLLQNAFSHFKTTVIQGFDSNGEPDFEDQEAEENNEKTEKYNWEKNDARYKGGFYFGDSEDYLAKAIVSLDYVPNQGWTINNSLYVHDPDLPDGETYSINATTDVFIDGQFAAGGQVQGDSSPTFRDPYWGYLGSSSYYFTPHYTGGDIFETVHIGWWVMTGFGGYNPIKYTGWLPSWIMSGGGFDIRIQISNQNGNAGSVKF